MVTGLDSPCPASDPVKMQNRLHFKSAGALADMLDVHNVTSFHGERSIDFFTSKPNIP